MIVLRLVGLLVGLQLAAGVSENDPILDRLARLRHAFQSMHHKHGGAPARQEEQPEEEAPVPEDASPPQMSFSQASLQPMQPMQPMQPVQPMQSMQPQPMEEMQRPAGNFPPPPVSMGQMNIEQARLGPPSQGNFAQQAPQDDLGSASSMEEDRRDDNDNDAVSNPASDRAAKSDPIVQRLALLKNNFAKMHHSHRSENSEQNVQATNARQFSQPLDQNPSDGDSQYQPNPALMSETSHINSSPQVDAPPSALDMSPPQYGSRAPLSSRKAVFGLKMPDISPPDDDSPAPQAGFQQSFQQTGDSDTEPPTQEDEEPEPAPQPRQAFNRANDPIIARLSHFRDNIEKMRSSQKYQERAPKPSVESDDDVAEQNGMTAFSNFHPDSSSPDSSPTSQHFQSDGAMLQNGMNINVGFQSPPPVSRAKPSMSAAEVIQKLQMEGNAQLQAEFHPQSQPDGGFEPNVLPGVQPDPQAMPEMQSRPDDMGAEEIDNQESLPMRPRRRMNLWQSQQQDRGSLGPPQFPQQRDQMQQSAGFLEQQRSAKEPLMQRQMGSEEQQDAPATILQQQQQMEEQGEQAPQGQPDPDQDGEEQPPEQGQVDNDVSRQDDEQEERPVQNGQHDDPIMEKLNMLQNNFKHMRDNRGERNSEKQEEDHESRQDAFVAQDESRAHVGSDDSGVESTGPGEAPEPSTGGPLPDYQAESGTPVQETSMQQQSSRPMGPSLDGDGDEDAPVMAPPAMTLGGAPHKWSLLQGQATTGQGTMFNMAQSSRSVLPLNGQLSNGQQPVDPDIVATDKSIDAQVAEAEAASPSSAITDLISQHSHHHIDEKLAMIQENFEKIKDHKRGL